MAPLKLNRRFMIPSDEQNKNDNPITKDVWK